MSFKLSGLRASPLTHHALHRQTFLAAMDPRGQHAPSDVGFLAHKRNANNTGLVAVRCLTPYFTRHAMIMEMSEG